MATDRLPARGALGTTIVHRRVMIRSVAPGRTRASRISAASAMPPGDRGRRCGRPRQPPAREPARRQCRDRGRVRVAARRGHVALRPRGGPSPSPERPARSPSTDRPGRCDGPQSCPPVRVVRFGIPGCNGCARTSAVRGGVAHRAPARLPRDRREQWLGTGPCARATSCHRTEWSGRRWSTWLGGAMARGADHAARCGRPRTTVHRRLARRVRAAATHPFRPRRTGSGFAGRAAPTTTGRRGRAAVRSEIRGANRGPPDGRPIIFSADTPPRAGYPVVAVLDPHSADLAAQCRRPVRHVRLTGQLAS